MSDPFARRLLFGHRGASTHERENTVASFTRALKDGANAIETDAHRSKDGHIVLAHDPDLARVFGVSSRIVDLTRAELEAHDVPALVDVLARFPDVPINIDVKQREPRIERDIVQTLEKAGASKRVLLTSFFDDVVGRVRDLGYDGPTGLAYREVARVYALPVALNRVFRVRGARAQVPTQSGRARFATRRFVDRCHALGIAVDFWVINDAVEARTLVELGADGIMSDDPGAVRDAVQPAALAVAGAVHVGAALGGFE